MSTPVRRSKRKAAQVSDETMVHDAVDALAEEVVSPAPAPAEETVVVQEENGDAKMAEASETAAATTEDAEEPAMKKARTDIAEAAAQAVADVVKAAPTTTEEEIAKTMVEGATAEGPRDPAKPTEGATTTAETTTEPAKAANEEPEKMEVEDGKADNKTTNGEKPSVPGETQPAAATESPTKQDMPPLKPETGAPADNAITAEAVAAMAGAASIPVPQPPPKPVYKKEQEEYEDLDDGMEIPEEDDSVWNAKLMQLLLYKAQYRTLHVQASYDAPLHTWVDVQRRLYRRHRKDPNLVSATTKMRLTALDAINFPFTLRGAAHWDRYYNKLQEFNKKHGHCLVPRLCEFAGLGDWVIDQRRQYKLMMQGKPSVLDPERQRKLEELGFVWVVRNRPEWNNRYQELLQYKEKYGDTKVPQHYKEISGLGKWVAKQREQFRLLSQGKHSFLTPDRLEKLNDAGFVWSVRKDATDDLAKIEGKKPDSPIIKKDETSPAPAAATTTTTTTTVAVEKPKEGEDEPPKEAEPKQTPAPAGETPAPAADPAAPAATLVADPQNPFALPETEAPKTGEAPGEGTAGATEGEANDTTKEGPTEAETTTV